MNSINYELYDILASTGITEHDIINHMKNGVFYYTSFEDFIAATKSIDLYDISPEDLQESFELFSNLDVVSYKGRLYYLDFAL